MEWQIRPSFMQEVNDLLEYLGLPWHCIGSVKPDGDCFFHAVIAQLQDQDILVKTHPRARRCKSSLELREAVVDWARSNPTLRDVEGFKVIKNWDKYLSDMRKSGEWADQHIICLTAMFMGKNILLATDTCTKERPWHPIELSEEGPFTHPPITLGYLRQRHFEPIVRKPNNISECLGCGWSRGKTLRGHIAQSRKNCKFFYDAEALDNLSRQRHGAATESEDTQQASFLILYFDYINLIANFTFFSPNSKMKRSFIKQNKHRVMMIRSALDVDSRDLHFSNTLQGQKITARHYMT